MAKLFVKGPIVVQNGLMVGPNKKDAKTVIDEEGNVAIDSLAPGDGGDGSSGNIPDDPYISELLSKVCICAGMFCPLFEVVSGSESSIAVGDLLAITGIVADSGDDNYGKLLVSKAFGGDQLPLPATIVSESTAEKDDLFNAIGVSHLTGIDTDSCIAGAPVMLSSETAGAFAPISAPAPGTLFQYVGVCLVKDQTEGEVVLFPFYQQGGILVPSSG